MSENIISNIKVNGTSYVINDPSKVSQESFNELSEIIVENNDLINSANSKLNELLERIGESGSESNLSNFLFAKVTSYKPAVKAYTSVSAIIVSGYGMAGEYEDEDYSIYNGKYINTPATESSSTPIEWIFKHETESVYLFYYADEYGDYEGWFFDTQYDYGRYESLANKTGTALPSGEMSWYGPYNTFTLSLTPQLANHEAEEQVLKVVKVSIEDNKWELGEDLTITKYANTPLKHGIYLTNNDYLIGDPIAYHDDNTEYVNPSGLIMHFPMDEDGGEIAIDIVNGLKLVRSGNGVYATGEGWKCVKNNENLMGIIDAFEFPEKFTISIDVKGHSNDRKYIEWAPLFCFGESEIGENNHEKQESFGLTADVSKSGWSSDEKDMTLGYRYFSMNSQYNDGVNLSCKVDEVVNYTLTYDGSKITIYLNGNSIKDGYNQVHEVSIPKKISPLMLLFSDIADNSGEHYKTFLDGTISKVTMWNRVLNKEEVTLFALKSPLLQSIVPSGFTSNTSMNGYVIDQNSYGYTNYPNAYQLFNCNESLTDYGYCSGDRDSITADNPLWFSITIPSAVIPAAIYYRNEVNSPENFKTAIFQARNNDNEEWKDLLEVTNLNEEGYYTILPINNEENNAYKQFRMLFTSAYNSSITLQSFKIYSNETAYNSKWNNLIHK